MSVSDDGQGVPSTEVEQLFFAERQRVHALTLLRRRLQVLFGRSFQLEVRSEVGEGTTVTMRIPLRKRFGVGLESPRAIPTELCELGQIKSHGSNNSDRYGKYNNRRLQACDLRGELRPMS